MLATFAVSVFPRFLAAETSSLTEMLTFLFLV